MDNSVSSWFSELDMEDPFLNDQCDIMDFPDEELSAKIEDFQNTLSPQGNKIPSTLIPRSNSTTTLSALSGMEAPQINSTERQAQQQKSIVYNQPRTLTFGNPILPEINPQELTLCPGDDAVPEVWTHHNNGSFVNLDEATKSAKKKKKTGGRVRPASQTYDHIIAERKRREQLSQRFVALSAIVPGLKKMDKTSVLGDAITYLKHLQERVNTLEEQAAKQTMESVVLVKRSQILLVDEGSSDEMGGSNEQPLPQIEAKVEKLNLAVINLSVAPFGRLALDITIIAEMEKEYSLTMRELLRSLRSALQRGTQANWM
ncbi:hypothetical protein ACH5RR_026642 [Cinchona calisaya]|uniref:BHLH domain-containing protein n=1 Tax=Cinchona calisaya TaxID=153742 RepID=A0ABD2Z6G2_9GENT